MRGGCGRTDEEAMESAIIAFVCFAGIAILMGAAWAWGCL